MGIGSSVSHSGAGRRDRRKRYASQASAARTAAIKNSSTGQPAAVGQTVVKAPVSAAVAFAWVPTRSRAAWIAFGHPTRRAISRVIPRARARSAHQEKAFGERFALLRFRRRSSTLPTRKNEDPGLRRPPARGCRLRDRLAAGVQVRQIEGERRDEEDGQDQEQRDRPRELSAAKSEHIRAMALGAHNDFPEGPGCAGQAELSCSKKRFRLRSP